MTALAAIHALASSSPLSTMFKRALTEKTAEDTDRIASIVEFRGSGGGGKKRSPCVSKSVADGWDPAPPGQ